MKTKYYRTVFQIEVLSEDRISGDADLEYILSAITDGDCSGVVRCVSSLPVSAKAMARLLIEQGSDPGFFGLDENGRRLKQ